MPWTSTDFIAPHTHSSSTWVTGQGWLNVFEAGLLTHSCRKSLSRRHVQLSLLGQSALFPQFYRLCVRRDALTTPGDLDLGENPGSFQLESPASDVPPGPPHGPLILSPHCLSLLCLSTALAIAGAHPLTLMLHWSGASSLEIRVLSGILHRPGCCLAAAFPLTLQHRSYPLLCNLSFPACPEFRKLSSGAGLEYSGGL